MSAVPIHRRIADDLRTQITTGALSVGAQLPSEAELREQWGVSRGPVRQALASLRAAGTIGGGPGRPPVVRASAMSQSFDTFLSFSRWATELGAQPGQQTIEIALRGADAEVADALNLEPGTMVVRMLRVRLLDGRRTMVERLHLVESVGRILLEFDTDSGSVYTYLRSRGVELSWARHTFDARLADQVDSELLDLQVGSPLLRERRLAGNGLGELYEYSDDRYIPELVTFSIENRHDMPSTLARTSIEPCE